MFEQYQPSPLLSPLIECFWAVNALAPYRREKIIPLGVIDLMFNFGSTHRVIDRNNHANVASHKTAWVAGMQTAYLLTEVEAETNLIGVRFKPGGAYPFLGLPIGELTNGVIELDAIWGGWVEEVREHLAEAPDLPAKFRLLETLLMERLGPQAGQVNWQVLTLTQRVSRQIMQTKVQPFVRDLSDHVGVSHKQLIHYFHTMVGVTPKQLARIVRFNQALRLIPSSQSINWLQLAHQCGYYDQAHFNHDFKAFSGLAPSAYMQQMAQWGDKLGEEGYSNFVPVQ